MHLTTNDCTDLSGSLEIFDDDGRYKSVSVQSSIDDQAQVFPS